MLVYHIDRATDPTRPAPAMEIVGVQKYPWRSTAHGGGGGGGHPASPTSATSPQFALLATSPPVSPTAATFAHAHAHTLVGAGAGFPPQSPMMATRIGAPGGGGPPGPMEELNARMIAYSYSMPQYGFQS